MPKRAVRPRYHACRQGWFVQIGGKRICLARGDREERSVWAAAVAKWWVVKGETYRGAIPTIDWEAVNRDVRLGEDRTQREWVRWWLDGRSDAEIIGLLRRHNLPIEKLAQYVPMPPSPRAATDAEIEEMWERRREHWGAWAPLLRIVGDRLRLEEPVVERLARELIALDDDALARLVLGMLERAARG